MIVPLLLGALLNTFDQQYFSPVQKGLHLIGAPMETRQIEVVNGQQPKELWKGYIKSDPYENGDQTVVDVGAHRNRPFSVEMADGRKPAGLLDFRDFGQADHTSGPIADAE